MISSSSSEEINKQLDGMVEWLKQRPHPNDFILHLIGLLGATLAGVKPAEILTLAIYTDKTRKLVWEESYSCLSQHKELKLKDIRYIRDNKQILFYHLSALEMTLERPIHLRFLKGLGYPENYSLEGYLDHLRERLTGKNFPHEIGIFLGYPLKDVMGFIGHPSLKLNKTRSWRVYGNANISDLRYQSFKQARTEVVRIISSKFLQKSL
jgi:hypothetical protein